MSTVPPPPAEGPGEDPDEPSGISDEQWDAFLRDTVEGSGAAAPKEPSARARMVARRLREEAEAEARVQARPQPRPRRRGLGRGRGWKGGTVGGWLRGAVPWIAAGVVVVLGAFQLHLFPSGGGTGSEPDASGPAEAVALTGGGVTDGDRCGTRGYHYFPLPATASEPAPPQSGAHPAAGPQLKLGSLGYLRESGADPGHFSVGLLFAPGPKGALEVSRTLGGEGVAVEIEGPDGLVGGAHGVPVTWGSSARNGGTDPNGIDLSEGGSASVTLPTLILCPGYDANTVMTKLQAPTDSSNTITGQPAYTLIVSVRDAGIGKLRTSLGLPGGGNLLSANNLVGESDTAAFPAGLRRQPGTLGAADPMRTA
ncbi:hypothetical protein ACL02U_13750 [Streptomyces sp. MS06]|uniref:hypothetical protein n=1 Tax=Streptomyces sp. MS06 TaxID=3385974 RepID=UPI0039A32EE9